jgi:hypothetical protein
VTFATRQAYDAAMSNDSAVIAAVIEEVLAALTGAGVPDEGTIDDMIGSARIDGGCHTGVMPLSSPHSTLIWQRHWVHCTSSTA